MITNFHRLWAGLFFFIFMYGCADSKPSLKLPELSPNAVLLAFGDSLTEGYGVGADSNYPAILEQLIGYRVINAGVSGELSEQGKRRLPELLQQYQPELLILCHGGNDILQKRSLISMKQNLQEMIDLAKQNDITVILLGVPEPGIFLSSHEVYRQLADENNLLLIGNALAEVLADNSLKLDMVHPNVAGYRLIAEEIYTTIKNAGGID